MVKIKKESQNVIALSIGMIFALGILFGTNPPIRNALLTYIVFLGISIFIYRLPRFQKTLIGIGKKNLGRSVFFGLLFGGGFFLATKFVPGLSLGLPRLGTIGDSLRFIIVVFVASISEEIFFRGGLLAYIRTFNPTKRNITLAIILQGVLFGLAHLGSYILGIYSFPNLPTALASFGQNAGAFVAATTFGIVAGWFVSRGGIRNLAFSIIFHMLLNAIILTSLSVIFVGF